MPAGYLQEDGVNYMVSVGDSISSRQELSDMVLFDLGLEGVEPVKLSDVAEIVVTDNSDEIYAKLNGDNGVIVSFNKQSPTPRRRCPTTFRPAATRWRKSMTACTSCR